MLKHKIDYVDFNGVLQQQEVYFNMTEADYVRFQAKYPSLEETIQSFDPENDGEAILNMFERIVRISYGVKSDDGQYFVRSPEKTEAFMNSAAYSALFMWLFTDAENAVSFFNSVVTQTVVKKT